MMMVMMLMIMVLIRRSSTQAAPIPAQCASPRTEPNKHTLKATVDTVHWGYFCKCCPLGTPSWTLATLALFFPLRVL